MSMALSPHVDLAQVVPAQVVASLAAVAGEAMVAAVLVVVVAALATRQWARVEMEAAVSST